MSHDDAQQVGQLLSEIEMAEKDVKADMGPAALDEGYSDLVHAVMQTTTVSKAAKAIVLQRLGLLEYWWAEQVLS